MLWGARVLPKSSQCRYIIETGLLEPLVDLCRRVVELMNSEVNEEMGGELGDRVSPFRWMIHTKMIIRHLGSGR